MYGYEDDATECYCSQELADGACDCVGVVDECAICDGPGAEFCCEDDVTDCYCSQDLADAGCVGMSNVDNILPESFAINQVYPNPFNPSTSIEFDIPKISQIQLSIFDLNGKLVKTLIDRTMTAGVHTIIWSGHNLNGQPMPTGIYLCKMLAENGAVSTYKLALIK